MGGQENRHVSFKPTPTTQIKLNIDDLKLGSGNITTMIKPDAVLSKITEGTISESGDVVFNLHLTAPNSIGSRIFKLILNINEFIKNQDSAFERIVPTLRNLSPIDIEIVRYSIQVRGCVVM